MKDLENVNVSRRDFVKSSMVMSGGILLSTAPGKVFAQANPKNNAINVAIIGIGAQGRVLMESLAEIEGLNFKAVCDIWEPARKYGYNWLGRKTRQKVNVYEDVEDMLEKEKDLDAAIVATPDLWHAPHTNMCLKAGLDVYCEKMMARTVDEARSMVKTAQETGKLLQIGHQRRSNPRYIHAFEKLINEAKIAGRLTNANGQWNRSVAGSADIPYNPKLSIPKETLNKYGYADMYQFRNWRWFKELSGGPISDLGAHQIDIFNWYFQARPTSVMASGGADYFAKREWYDNVMVIYEYPQPEGAARAFYQVLTTTSAGGGYYEQFMGDQGSIKMSENPSLSKIYREDASPDWDQWVNMNYVKRSEAYNASKESTTVDSRETAPLVGYDLPIVLNKPPHMPHLENFFSAMRGEAKLNCDALHAFESEAAIFKVNDAVEQKRTIEFTDADFAV